MNSRLQRFLRYWLPVLLWLAVITFESTDTMSARNTGRLLFAVIAKVAALLNLSGADVSAYVEFANRVMRKCGHFLGYGVLSLLLFRAFLASFKTVLARCALLAIAGTALIAAIDEYHQTFIPSRTGSFRDVLLDICGAVLLQLIVLAFVRLRQKRSALAG